MKHPDFSEEKILQNQGFKFIAGLDEAGRGPLAGPVVAAAVLIKPNLINKAENKNLLKGINDSKKLSEKQRDKLYDILTNHKDIGWGIGIVDEKIIDKINIFEATKLAMQKAIEDLQGKSFYCDFLLVDGNFKIDLAQKVSEKKCVLPKQKSIIRGDQKVISIASASVIAKVTRDRIMCEYDKKYPQYFFGRHKGYPTKVHIEMLKKFGISPIHRKSFSPINSLFLS